MTLSNPPSCASAATHTAAAQAKMRQASICGAECNAAANPVNQFMRSPTYPSRPAMLSTYKAPPFHSLT